MRSVEVEGSFLGTLLKAEESKWLGSWGCERNWGLVRLKLMAEWGGRYHWRGWIKGLGNS